MENIEIPEQNEVGFEIELPTACPHCQTNYNDRILDAFFLKQRDSLRRSIFVLFFCSRCEKCFLIEYDASGIGSRSGISHVRKCYPYPSEQREFPKNIGNLSNSFEKIYWQSQLAEQQGLNEICGSGYRKALEFLIKDFAMLFNPNEEDKIKSMLLAQCIEQYMDNKHIRVLSKASAWIGNDETHYIRKHEDYDLESLKSFVHATVAFIDSDIEFHKAHKLINKKKN